MKIGRHTSWLAGLGLAAGAVALAASCGGSPTGVSGTCTGSGPGEREVRVHVDNGQNLAGLRVALSAGGQTCVIAAMIVDDLQQGNESDQVIMDLDVGTVVTIQVGTGATAFTDPSTVDELAFDPQNTGNRGQAFVTVFPQSVIAARASMGFSQ